MAKVSFTVLVITPLARPEAVQAISLTVVFLIFLAIGLVGLFIALTDKGLNWNKGDDGQCIRTALFEMKAAVVPGKISSIRGRAATICSSVLPLPTSIPALLFVFIKKDGK